MSDGPYRSLKMPRGWKKLAERADKKAYAPEEVRDALPDALEQDWRAEVPDGVCSSDHTKARPSARWGRDIMLRVPVHDPAHWRSAAVSGALQGALGFLTGDRAPAGKL